MKIVPFLFSVAILASACEQSTKPTETTMTLKSDTTFVVKPELPVQEQEASVPNETEPKAGPVAEKKSSTPVKKPAKRNERSSTSTTDNTAAAAHGNGTTETQDNSTATETKKKGWSKTAKGAVIGGVVGAGTGAVINGKNRAAGAVIGGVIGAGAGAVIGNKMDKKDGRH